MGANSDEKKKIAENLRVTAEGLGLGRRKSKSDEN